MAAELQYRGVSIGYSIGYPHFTQSAEQVAALGELGWADRTDGREARLSMIVIIVGSMQK